MDLGLSKKIALVTGSTAGIGLACAKILAQEGATVYINGRSKERVDQAIHEIGTGLPLVADLATKEGCQTLIERIPSVDILVNNLGIYGVKEFSEITDDEWFHFFDVNVRSGIRLSRHYLPKMQANKWGRIVFISSESAVNVPTEMIHYGMTKTCQLVLTQGLAQLAKGSGVTVNAVLPGPTYSEGVQQFISEMAASRGIDIKQAEREFFQTVRPSSLIQRFATIDEVGALVAFVCSEKAAAITGSSLRHDGGIIRSIL